jgi:lipid A disaccharide synthetase
MAFPELLQEECTAASLVAHAAPLFDPASATGMAQRVALAEVKAKVGGPGAAGRAADLAIELVDA